MPIKRKTLVDTKKAESIIEAGEGGAINTMNKEIPSLNKEKISLPTSNKVKKEKITPVNLQINESNYETLKKFALEKNLRLYEVFNFMSEFFIADLSRFDVLINKKNTSTILLNCSEGWKLVCPVCHKEGIIKDPDGKKFIQLKKELKTSCPNCGNALHISGIEM